MKYPKLKDTSSTRELVDVFKGYNHNLRIGDGEFYDMKNLTSDNYPVLSTRKKRGLLVSPGGLTLNSNIISKDGLCYVSDNTLIYQGEGYEPEGTDYQFWNGGKKTLVSMGARVAIFQPGYNFLFDTTTKKLETMGIYIGNASVTLCTQSGLTDLGAIIQNEKPNDGAAFWVDTSTDPPYIKHFNYEKDKYEVDGIACTRIGFSNKWFKEGDSVVIKDTTYNLSGTRTIVLADEYGIVVEGMLPHDIANSISTASVEIGQNIPTMDFVVESENRLWGCRYGENRDGKIVNEIYASALGEPHRWTNYIGLANSSYAVSVGSDGEFTGAITYLGYPMFFKENCVHKIYGNYPSNYQVQTTALRGVQKGCSESLAIVNEALYYKSRSGVCAYDGSLPVEVSDALGDVQYSNAAAGAIGNKYYISMQENGGEWHMFAYDVRKGVWDKEDETHATAFCAYQNDLFYADYSDKSIRSVYGIGAPILNTTPMDWMAVTGMIGMNSTDKKYVTGIDIRMQLSLGSRVHVFAEYDSSEEWRPLFSHDGVNLNTFTIPVVPVRCDHMRLKFLGKGDAKIFSITKKIE